MGPPPLSLQEFRIWMRARPWKENKDDESQIGGLTWSPVCAKHLCWLLRKHQFPYEVGKHRRGKCRVCKHLVILFSLACSLKYVMSRPILKHHCLSLPEVLSECFNHRKPRQRWETEFSPQGPFRGKKRVPPTSGSKAVFYQRNALFSLPPSKCIICRQVWPCSR